MQWRFSHYADRQATGQEADTVRWPSACGEASPVSDMDHHPITRSDASAAHNVHASFYNQAPHHQTSMSRIKEPKQLTSRHTRPCALQQSLQDRKQSASLQYDHPYAGQFMSSRTPIHADQLASVHGKLARLELVLSK
jgi:hypothetical protein